MKGKIISVILAVLLIAVNAHGLKKISEYDEKQSPSDGDYMLFELANNSDFNHATIAHLKANTFQSLDSDLTILAGLTYSANMQSFLAAANYAAMRTLLGLVIGTNVQAYDADLTIYAGITPSANVQSLLAAATYAAIRALLDLEPGTDFYSISAANSAFEGTLTNEAGLYSALSDVSIFYEPGDTVQTGSSTSLPGTCTVGETYIDTNADTDGTLYICVATNTWKDVDDDGGPGGINDIVDDVSPQLGGNLDIQGFNIEGVDATEFGYLDGVTGDIQTGKQEDLDVPSQAEAEAGTATDERVWTAQRVGQAIAALAGGGTDDQVASEVPNTPAGNIAATDVQAAINELDTEKAAIGQKLDDFGTPDDNTDLNATTTYHGLLPKLDNNASNFLNGQGAWAVPAGGGDVLADGSVPFTGEVTIDELGIEFQETDNASLTDCSLFSATGGGVFYDDSENIFKKCQNGVLSDLDTNTGDDNQTAAEVPNTPAGNIAATDVQDAIDELDDEKQPLDSTLTDISDGTITENLVNTANPWADNEVDNTQTLDVLILSELTSAPTPVAGRVYLADGVTWDPSGLGIGKAYYVIYDGSDYIAMFDEDGAWHISGVELTTLESDQLIDTSDPHGLSVVELKNKILSNVNSVGADEWDFPARTEGWNFMFVIEAVQNVTLDPNGTEQWYLNGTQMAAGKAIVNTSPTVAESIACYSTETAVYCESKYSDWAEETP